MNGCVTTRAFAVNLSAVRKVHDVVTFTPQPQGSNAEFVGVRPRGGVDVRVLTTVVMAQANVENTPHSVGVIPHVCCLGFRPIPDVCTSLAWHHPHYDLTEAGDFFFQRKEEDVFVFPVMHASFPLLARGQSSEIRCDGGREGPVPRSAMRAVEESRQR